MDKNFIRRSFYVDPPSDDATPEEWAEWLKKDERQARTAKAKFTRTRAAQEVDCDIAMSVVKVNGVYKQLPSLGYDEVNGFNPCVDASQEDEVDSSRFESVHRRGGNKKYRNKEKRERIRTLRRAKYRGR